MPCWGIGCLTWSANATASRWRWTGPNSTPTVGDDHAVSVGPPRTGHAAGLADRGQGDAEKPSNGYEYQVLVRLAVLPADVRVRIMADRLPATGSIGPGEERKLTSSSAFAEYRGHRHRWRTRAAAGWRRGRGGHRVLGHLERIRSPPWSAWGKGMKEPWCLAASTADEPRGLGDQPVCGRWEMRGFRTKGSPLRHRSWIDDVARRTGRPSVADMPSSGLADALGAAGKTGLRSAPQDQNTSNGALIRCSVGEHALRTIPNMTDFLLLPLISPVRQMLEPPS